jgi:Ca2+-binding RTX toxin-like protein
VDLGAGLGWTYFWGTGTWIDELGRMAISNVENLRGTAQGDRLVGTAGSNVMEGQAGNDWIDGGGGADTLDGGWGLDTLTGGGGSDRFVMSASLAASNADTVTDFSVTQGDTLALDDAVFTLLAGKTSLANHFRLSTQAAVGGDDYLVYNPGTGALSYDASGKGTGTAQVFATLANKPQDLTAAQFVVI